MVAGGRQFSVSGHVLTLRIGRYRPGRNDVHVNTVPEDRKSGNIIDVDAERSLAAGTFGVYSEKLYSLERRHCLACHWR